ncbi:protein phosphatase regulatory subunit Sds22 [Cryptotrichosporon argae]
MSDLPASTSGPSTILGASPAVGPETAPATAGDTAPARLRPRARLGPTEVVELPASDSEDEDEAEDGGAAPDEDFLRDWPDDSDDIQLQHLRLKTSSLAPLRLPRFGSALHRLCLRQNELASPLPAEAFTGLTQLEELDLYDNRLGPRVTDDELGALVALTSLDLSFNNIRHAPVLPSLTKLQVLYLVQNKIARVDEGALDWCADSITSLELGGNRIRVIEHLERLVHLTELWLGKNKIRELQNLSTFSNLKILSIQSNRITKLENLEGLVNLEELYLSHNGLTKIEGLEKNTKLRTLDVGNNEIEEIENIAHLVELEEFWASNNKIPTLRALDTQLAHLAKLETVYLEGNPCQTADRAGYRRKVMLALPQVRQIDATRAAGKAKVGGAPANEADAWFVKM